jgi:hypothetical protein
MQQKRIIRLARTRQPPMQLAPTRILPVQQTMNTPQIRGILLKYRKPLFLDKHRTRIKLGTIKNRTVPLPLILDKFKIGITPGLRNKTKARKETKRDK